MPIVQFYFPRATVEHEYIYLSSRMNLYYMFSSSSLLYFSPVYRRGMDRYKHPITSLNCYIPTMLVYLRWNVTLSICQYNITLDVYPNGVIQYIIFEEARNMNSLWKNGRW